MTGLPPDAKEPSYLPRARGRTRILLSGAESLEVLETVGFVMQQLEQKWAVVRMDETTSVHVRSEAVVGLVDLGHPHLKAA